VDTDAAFTLVGLAVGILGAAFAVGVVMAVLRGSFSRVLAAKPPAHVAPVGRQELIERLLALDDPAQPFHYRTDSQYDLVAEWRIADASWWGFFSRYRLQETYRAKICLNEAHREARVLEERARVRWVGNGSQPSVSWEAHRFQGVVLAERTREVEYGFRRPLSPDWGRVVDYDFDVWRVKGPIRDTVLASGWIFCPVTRESHLRANRPLAR